MPEPGQLPFSFTDAKPAKGGTQTAAQPAPASAKTEVPRRRGRTPVVQPPALPTDSFLAVIEILNRYDIKTARRMLRALMEFWG